MAHGLGDRPAVDQLTAASAIRDAISGVLTNRTPRGTSVMLDGPPGIGKSHLMRGVLGELPPDVPVRCAVGSERTRHEAFALVRQLIPDLSPAADPAAAATDRIDEWCSHGPALIWVDDAHHADAASLSVLRRLVWAAQDLALVVVVATRGFPSPPPLELLASEVTRRMTLAPMDAMMTERLVFDRTGRWPGRSLIRVLDGADGNPLFAVELLRRYENAAALTNSTPEQIDIRFELPPIHGAIEGIVRDHLQQLDEQAQGALRSLAVWGPQGRLPDLAVVAGQTVQQLAEALAVTDRAGITATDPSGAVHFSHDLYRDVVLIDMPESVRRNAHRAAAQVLAAAGHRPALVAEHLLQADPDDQSTRSQFLHALGLAVAATEMYAPEVAADLLDEADEITAIDPELRETMLLQRVRNAFIAGRGESAERLVRDRLPAIRSPGIAAALQTLLTRSLINRAETSGALTAIDLTLAIDGLPDAARRQLRATRCWVQLLAGQVLSTAHTESLLAEFVDAKDLEAQASILVTMACAQHLAGRPDVALALNARRAVLSIDQQEFQARSTAVVWPTHFHLAHTGPAAATVALEDARRTSAEHNSHWIDGFLAGTAGLVAFAAGDWAESSAEFDSALEQAQEGNTGWTSIQVGLRSYIDAHRGDANAATARLDTFRRRRLPLQFGQDHPGLAELAILEAAGSGASAYALGRALWRQARVRPGLWMLELAVDVTRIALAVTDRTLADQIAQDLESVPLPTALIGIPHLVRGMVTNDADEIAHGASDLGRVGLRVLEAFAWEELACAAALAADRARASHALDLALTGFRRFGAVKDSDRTLSRLRALGVRRGAREANRTATFGWASLTPSEFRIAALVREGLTNREIGTRLFVSPRTVQTHVAHILAKTGLRSRVEIAAAVISEFA